MRPAPQNKHPGWKAFLAIDLTKYNKVRANPKRTGSVSDKTRAEREGTLYACFNQLHELGFKIQNPRTIDHKRITALVTYWVSQKETVGNICRKLSVLRVHCGWIGKRSLVLSADEYSPGLGKRARSTVRDRRPVAKGLDVSALIGKAISEDPAFGAMLWLENAFGLRRLEAIMICTQDSIAGNVIHLTRGCKNGRHRTVQIVTAEQVAVLEFAKWITGKSKSLGHAMYGAYGRLSVPRTAPADEISLKAAVNRYQYLMRKLGFTATAFGFTGHDLRASYAIEKLAHLGFAAPIMSFEEVMERQLKPLDGSAKANDAILTVMDDMGHNRSDVDGAYYGRLRSAINELRPRVAQSPGYAIAKLVSYASSGAPLCFGTRGYL